MNSNNEQDGKYKILGAEDITPPGKDGYQYRLHLETPDGEKMITATCSGTLYAINQEEGLGPKEFTTRQVTATLQKNPSVIAGQDEVTLEYTTFGLKPTSPVTSAAPPKHADVTPDWTAHEAPTLIPKEAISEAYVVVCKLRAEINSIVELFLCPDELHLIGAFLKPDDYDGFTCRMNDLHELNSNISPTLSCSEQVKGTFRKLESWLVHEAGTNQSDAKQVYSVFEAIRVIRLENTHGDDNNRWAYNLFGLTKPIESDFAKAYDSVVGKYIDALKVIRNACSRTHE